VYGTAPPAIPIGGSQPSTPFLQPSANIQGANLAQPGAAESFYGQNQNQFTNPNALQQYWSSVGSNFNNPGKNNSQAVFNQFQSTAPPDTSSYYNNAVLNANSDISKAMAAQGLTGSSAALGQMSAADQNLRAQQANANASYALQRGQLQGQFAGQADQTTLANLMGGGTIAGNVAGQNLNSLLGGASTANAAQQAQMAREGQGYNQLMGYGNAVTGSGNQIGQAGINTSNQLLNDYLTSSVAGPSATYGIQASNGGVPGGAADIIGGGINQVGGMMLGGMGGL
jgi:hypothetical protein